MVEFTTTAVPSLITVSILQVAHRLFKDLSIYPTPGSASSHWASSHASNPIG
jgi:hypothetical protein